MYTIIKNIFFDYTNQIFFLKCSKYYNLIYEAFKGTVPPKWKSFTHPIVNSNQCDFFFHVCDTQIKYFEQK